MPIQKIHPLSKEQLNLLHHSHSKFNLSDGPVRSGKNFIQNFRMLNACLSEPEANPKSDIVFAGISKDSIERNFLKDFFEIVGETNYTYDRGRGKGTLFGRSFYCFAAKNADSYKSLRGSTVGLALVTELTELHKDFYKELLARCSIQGAKIFADTNPGSPYHWIYTDLINNNNLKTKQFKRFQFNFNSNLSLSEDYKDDLKAFYGEGTLLYNRMILGQWCMADGIIYDMFNPSVHVVEKIPGKIGRTWLGVDYGTANPCVFLSVSRKNNVYYVTDEYYYDGRKDGYKTDYQYSIDLVEFAEDKDTRELFVDPSALSFKNQVKQVGLNLNVKEANNNVIEGIKLVSRLLSQNRLFIHKRCINLIREFSSYVWDTNAQKRGEDKPKKEHDHAQDALRYILLSVEQQKRIGKGWK